MYYKLEITEKTAHNFGQVIANTKQPHGQYKGMSESEFTEATKYITCFTAKVIEFN